MKRRCCVHNCPDPGFAKGLCRKHYGRFYRGKALEPVAPPKEEVPDTGLAEQELAHMRSIYDHVVGLEARLRWRRKIQDFEIFLVREKQRVARRAMAATG